MTSGTHRVLYADVDRESGLLMRDLLSPHHVDVAASDEEARLLARRHSYDLYIVGGGGPDSSGLPLCGWLHRIDAQTPIVFCSSNAAALHQKLAVEAGALRYLTKPVDPEVLRSTLSLLLKLAEIESRRAMTPEMHEIHDELVQRSRRAREASSKAKPKSQQALECMMRAKAYRAFRDAGGNRANFERLWPKLPLAAGDSAA
jgi:DNA-binding response OmpR family regulator